MLQWKYFCMNVCFDSSIFWKHLFNIKNVTYTNIFLLFNFLKKNHSSIYIFCYLFLLLNKTQNDLRTLSPYTKTLQHSLGCEAHTKKLITLFLFLRHLESKRKKSTSEFRSKVCYFYQKHALSERLNNGGAQYHKGWSGNPYVVSQAG